MSRIAPRPEQIQELLNGPADTPVVMLNLLRFKEEASEPDAGSSGAEAYGRYGERMIEWIRSQGARLIWSGRIDSWVIGDSAERFHMIALVEYPSRREFVRIVGDPRVEQYAVHRTAGLEMQWLIAATEVSGPAAVATAPEPDSSGPG